MFYVILFVSFCVLCKLYSKLSLGICMTNTCLVGKTAIVTGGNQGIGYQTVLGLAARGCRVIIADKDNSDASRELIIKETGNPNIISKQFDLSSIDSIKAFVKDILATEDKLDILINNAGISQCYDQKTKDGFNFMMQVNYFGPFLLTYLLIDLLKKAKYSKLIFTSSCMSFAHQLKEGKDIDYTSYNKIDWLRLIEVYSNSKMCTTICAQYFAEKLHPYGVICNSTYPGAVYTHILPLSVKSFWIYLKSGQEGAQTNLHVATTTDESRGEYFSDCHVSFKPPAAKNPKICKMVMKQTFTLLKIEDIL